MVVECPQVHELDMRHVNPSAKNGLCRRYSF
ncbi:Uncharacterised protein [Vibrio cholerae]|nr:Uncharacterised protein [Vibrio cholerae]